MLTRRSFLVGAACFSLTPLMVRGAAGGYPFSLGVASGSPRPDGGVLWTRLAPEPLAGGGMPPGPAAVRWRVAEDEAMRRVVREGLQETDEQVAHAVHVPLRGLEPARDYFYQFHVGDDDSPVGRLRTAGAGMDAARFAVVACQHFETGHWAGFRDLAAWAPDCVIHVGDYIYEGGASPLGAGTRGALAYEIVRQHRGEEIRSLWDYRNRYALYRMDPALQAAHAASSWIVAFDDHEVDNNWAGEVPQDPWAQSAAEFALRKQAALRAYYEHMPLERPPVPDGLGATLRLYGAYRFGPAQVHLLDTRQYRSDQACGDGRQDPERCEALDDPSRTMTGAVQEAWLFRELARSDARYDVLAQQTWFAPFRYGADDGTERVNVDQWDGYPRQRERMLEQLREASNPVILSGDWHAACAMGVHERPGDVTSRKIASEFTATSMSSLCPWQEDLAAARDRNAHVVHVDGTRRGYLRCEATAQAWTSTFRSVVDPLDPGSAVVTDLELRAGDV
ncbi:MAG: alkaline phosphatase D family protein [Pseudomonadales bacterium]|jgi:alkaline phosphatase D|nr:alkaline phosphatase D family protein [Pseudomonadales bacterium]